MTPWQEFALVAERRRVGRRLPRLFQNARLNVVGRSAVLGASAAAAAVGAGLASLAGSRAWVGAVVGLPVVVVVLVALDRRRTWRSTASLSWTDDAASVSAVAERLRRDGLDVSVEDGERPRLVFRAKDRRTVMVAVGVPDPVSAPWWW